MGWVVIGKLPFSLSIHRDHQPAEFPDLLPLLLWRRGLGRGGPFCGHNVAQSTYKNSFEFNSTWQRSTSAAAPGSDCAAGETSGLILCPLGDESFKASGSSKRQ